MSPDPLRMGGVWGQDEEAGYLLHFTSTVTWVAVLFFIPQGPVLPWGVWSRWDNEQQLQHHRPSWLLCKLSFHRECYISHVTRLNTWRGIINLSSSGLLIVSTFFFPFPSLQLWFAFVSLKCLGTRYNNVYNISLHCLSPLQNPAPPFSLN